MPNPYDMALRERAIAAYGNAARCSARIWALSAVHTVRHV